MPVNIGFPEFHHQKPGKVLRRIPLAPKSDEGYLNGMGHYVSDVCLLGSRKWHFADGPVFYA